MTAPAFPDHLLTIEEWEQLPRYEGFTVEVEEGVLRVSPRPITFHQRIMRNLLIQLNAQLPDTLEPLGELEMEVVRRPRPTVRIPDVLVVDTAYADTNPKRIELRAVHLAIEVLSEGNVRHDRVTKFNEYADHGIAQYWMVDPEAPVTLSAYVLAGSRYELDGEWTGVAQLRCAGHPVHVDVAALAQR